MKILDVETNDAEQRLDRFLKKYYKNAPLSHIYRLIRKDVKVNGRRAKPETVLKEGDKITLYVADDASSGMEGSKKIFHAKKQFKIAYEDDDMIVAIKPCGLLTHGDKHEKKNTLANQVCGYLIENGKYDPSSEKTFVPSPVNRLDRNTSGLVIFGKNAQALKTLNADMKDSHSIRKFYLTVVAGEMDEEKDLTGFIKKDSENNTVSLVDEGGQIVRSIARPIETADGFTFCEVEITTGRTHQIRAQMAQAGYPLIGDAKYGDTAVNKLMKEKYGLTSQLLHACRLVMPSGMVIEAEMPEKFRKIKADIFG